MHERLDHVGYPLGWLLIGAGSLMTWLYDHGMALFGIVLGLFGAWIQWKTYRLRERVARAKMDLE